MISLTDTDLIKSYMYVSQSICLELVNKFSLLLICQSSKVSNLTVVEE